VNLTPRLTIHLDAIVANWRTLDAKSAATCETAAVVKANAYGCGTVPVGQALKRAGVRTFFVAVPSEGAALRPAIGPETPIYVLGGYARDEAATYRAHDLRPVLASARQGRHWFEDAAGPCAIQLDTGMNRLGMEADEFAQFLPLPPAVDLVISHLGNADIPGDDFSFRQLAEFRRMSDGLGVRRSLSATAGLHLGPDYHFDMTRMGIALFGGEPFPEARHVVTAEVPVIQIRDIAAGETIGYGATWRAARPSRIATIAAGYADGVIRSCSNSAQAFIGGQPVPFVGRVSMDLVTLDVTDVPCVPGDMVELLGPHQSIEDLARAAGTIGHEVLTSLGARYRRGYSGG